MAPAVGVGGVDEARRLPGAPCCFSPALGLLNCVLSTGRVGLDGKGGAPDGELGSGLPAC